jgi:hypothetical protein
MKTLILLSLIITLCISCTKEPIETTNPGNVKISIDYAFSTSSGDITAKGAPIYLDFYTKYIFGKILTPKTYKLAFASHSSGRWVAGMSGKWGDKKSIFLPPDRYDIVGISYPTKYDICGDTCYLTFHDTATITQTTSNIVLSAAYDCSLLLFDTTNVTGTLIQEDNDSYSDTLSGYTFKTTMSNTEGFYFTFLRAREFKDLQHPGALGISLIYKNNLIYFRSWTYTFEPGKYYYFGNTDNNYSLTPMSNGEQ